MSIVSCCSARAYARLSVKEAQRLMMFATEAELVAYAQKLGWVLDKGWIVFADAAEGAGGGGKAGAAAAGGQGAAAGSLGLIKNSLVYAKELERIV